MSFAIKNSKIPGLSEANLQFLIGNSKQNKTKQNKTKQNEAKQKTKQNKTKTCDFLVTEHNFKGPLSEA